MAEGFSIEGDLILLDAVVIARISPKITVGEQERLEQVFETAIDLIGILELQASAKGGLFTIEDIKKAFDVL